MFLHSWSRKMPTAINHTFYLTCTLRKEGDWYVSECRSLPVTSQGKTETRAMANLMEAISLFIDSCIARGTLKEVLMKYHWRPRLQPPRKMAPRHFSLPVPLPQAVKAAS
jgi:predicted RNase H-like HicB family nuclease